jgi:hypothetical protein
MGMSHSTALTVLTRNQNNAERNEYYCGRLERRPGYGCLCHRPTDYFSVFFLMGWDWVHLVLRPLFGLLHQPRMIDQDDCGAIGGMRTDRGNWSTLRKPAPVPLCSPQIPHDMAWARTPAAAVGSRRLTAWAMARPPIDNNHTVRGSCCEHSLEMQKKQWPRIL